MTVQKIQFKSFTSPEGLPGSINGTGFNKGKKLYNKDGFNNTGSQLMEAQISKKAPGSLNNEKGYLHIKNEELYPKSRNNTIVIKSHSKSNYTSNKNLNKSNQKTAEISFGGLLNSSPKAVKSLTETKAWTFTIKNTKPEDIDIRIYDQIPVSSNSTIEVIAEETNGAILNNQNGILYWQIQLQPNEQTSRQLRYKVKYPKNQYLDIQ